MPPSVSAKSKEELEQLFVKLHKKFQLLQKQLNGADGLHPLHVHMQPAIAVPQTTLSSNKISVDSCSKWTCIGNLLDLDQQIRSPLICMHPAVNPRRCKRQYLWLLGNYVISLEKIGRDIVTTAQSQP